MATTRKRGRPKASPAPEGYDRTVRFRLSRDELEAFERRARALGLSVSAWLRMLARKDAGLT